MGILSLAATSLTLQLSLGSLPTILPCEIFA